MTKTNHSLTITRIEAKNLLRFVDFSVSPGKMTKFSGSNNEGKTSALRLAEIAMRGSTNPHVIHQGAEKGEVVVEFSDETKLRRSFTGANQYVKLTDEKGRVIPSPQKYLDNLLGEYREHQFNPIGWLDLPAKEQIRLLLNAIHVSVTPEEIAAAIGFEAPLVDFSRHGLEVLAEVREHFAAERKAENVTVERLRSEAATMRAKLPAEKPAVTAEMRDAARTRTAEARNARAKIDALALAATEHAKAVARIDSAIGRESADRDRLAHKVAELQAEIEKIEAQREQIALRMTALGRDKEELSSSTPPTPEERDAAASLVSEAEAVERSLSDLDRVAAEFDRAGNLESDATTHAITAAALDAAVKTLSNEMPRLLMAKAQLPVDSLSIDGERILIDGTDLQYQSTSKQIEISLAIARALNPKLRVICVDGWESLDMERQAAFVAAAAGDGYQYLVSQVTSGPLTVETDGVIEREPTTHQPSTPAPLAQMAAASVDSDSDPF